MLTVRSSVVSRAIPYKEVAFVAKTAQEQALTGVEEPPQETGICERFVDTIFCGGVKKTAKSQIHGMSHHTASLHLELQKPSEERNSGLIKTHIEKISENQKRLYGLMQGDTLEFGSVEERPVVGKDSYLIHRSPAKICPTGIPLYKPEHEVQLNPRFVPSAAPVESIETMAPIIERPAPENDTESLALPPPTILQFEKESDIEVRHFEQIRIAQKFICANKVYVVRFNNGKEPVVLCDDSDPGVISVKLQMFQLWFYIQTCSTKETLYSIKANAELHFPFPDTESELFRLRAERELEKGWDAGVDRAKIKLRKIVALLQKDIEADKFALLEKFEALQRGDFENFEKRSIYLDAVAKMSNLQMRQENMQSNIEGIKEVYSQLFQLARDCRTDSMQKIVLNRIATFGIYLEKFAAAKICQRAARDLNWVMKNQLNFVKEFSSAQLKLEEILSDQIEITLEDGADVQVPASDLQKTLKDELVKLSSNPLRSWKRSQDVMDIIKKESERLSKNISRQLNLGLGLDRIIKTFKGENGEGLDSETQLSYYTPRTYSRIVTLIGFRSELLNKYKCLEDDQIHQKVEEGNEHWAQIHRETNAIENCEQSEGFESHQLYVPERNVGINTPMNYSQWCDDQKSREVG